MQNRKGASVIQPYFDLWKLFHKNEVIPHDASWIFMAAPYIIFAITLILPLAIPFGVTVAASPLNDFLVVVYLLALLTFFLALAGIDAGSAFGGFGSSREMTLGALTEGVIIFSIVPLALLAHSSAVPHIASAIASLPLASYLPVAVAFLGFFIALMSETGRIPFDNPATHLELTMIHEAMILEYSGKRLALIEWASANKLLFFVALGANLFFPWGGAITASIPTVAIGLLLAFLKSLALLVVIGIIESSIAKLRLFRLPDLLMTGFIFCLIALITIGI
jgi:formate hydrogenlyase subunit 4